MASNNKFCATILIFSILFHFSTFSNACGTCQTKPKPSPPVARCPKDALKLGACVDLLGLVNISLGNPNSSKCCALLEGLADLEAALCLCTAIKANVLGLTWMCLLLSVCLLVLAKSLFLQASNVFN